MQRTTRAFVCLAGLLFSVSATPCIAVRVHGHSAQVNAILLEIKSSVPGTRQELAASLVKAFAEEDDADQETMWTLGSEVQGNDLTAGLVSKLSSSSSKERHAAAVLLEGASKWWNWSIRDTDLKVVLKVLETDSDFKSRARLAYILSHAKNRNPEVKRVLLELLKKDDEPSVRETASYALGCIGKEEPYSTGRLSWKVIQPNKRTAGNTEEFAIESSDQGSAIVAALGTALNQDTDPHVRASAAYWLGSMGSKAAASLPIIRESLRDSNSFVRCRALEALAGLGPSAGPALPDLIAILKQPEESMAMGTSWSYATFAIGRIGPKAAPAVPQLLKVVAERPSLEASFVQAMREIGPAARASLPTLQSMVGRNSGDEKKWYEKRSAQEAIDIINGKGAP
jgi:HEAT repeat protein